MTPTTRKCLLAIVVVLFAASCTTVGRRIETPSGQTNVVEGELNILRVLRRTVTTGNQPDANSGQVEEDIIVSCPANTVTVVPVPEQAIYGYGEIDPDDLSMEDALGMLSFTWSRPKQRPLGMVYTGLHVTDINAPDSSGEQSITIKATAFLTDDNSDDAWWHIQTFHVLCIGNRPPG